MERPQQGNKLGGEEGRRGRRRRQAKEAKLGEGDLDQGDGQEGRRQLGWQEPVGWKFVGRWLEAPAERGVETAFFGAAVLEQLAKQQEELERGPRQDGLAV
eukprot:7074787-Karenia_brevis.AAC.1